MKRRRVTKSAARIHLLRKSPAAQQIAARRQDIEIQMQVRRREIWPVAAVARLFGISTRLLWQWIGDGYLSKSKPSQQWRKDARGEPLRCLRHGVSHQSVVNFICELAQVSRVMVPGLRPRFSPATQRCRELSRSLDRNDRPTPLEFAARAGVSVATVRRLMKNGSLGKIRVSRGRLRIRPK